MYKHRRGGPGNPSQFFRRNQEQIHVEYGEAKAD